eukprot:TRINITY_DN5872_c0_g1_i1.p1 TRINITY_DN5872_c0_g1~~TRINITY_DN5872_c0_g1_i1.p1  ORF type:complete len:608 (+),score=99.90 TRINITY_DN5872_c0_g1_i1:64-1887(+)
MMTSDDVPPPPAPYVPPPCSAEVTRAVEAAIASFSRGGFVLVSDSHQRCDLILAAEHATTERIAFMIRNSTGIINASLDRDRLEGFGLHPAALDSSGVSSSAAYVSVDCAEGISNGVSAKDRATTLRTLSAASSNAASLKKPGHIFPLCVRESGVLSTDAGVVEATYELCRLAKIENVGVLAEMMNDDGTMFTQEDAMRFSKQHEDIPVITVDDLATYIRNHQPSRSRTRTPPAMESESSIWIDDIDCQCKIRVYRTASPQIEIITIIKGEVSGSEGVPVRVHSECFTGDILGSRRCDCGQQLHRFLRIMNDEACGIMVYIKGHEGRGIGLANKIRAYKLQDEGRDTVDANTELGLPIDSRSYEDALYVLRDHGVRSVRLFTNNPEKARALKPIMQDVVSLASIPCEQNISYLQTKRERLNHRTVLETFKPPVPKVDLSMARIGIVYTSWNEFYVSRLLQGAESSLLKSGVRQLKMAVPGACELVSGARAMIKQSSPDTIIVLGALIKGSSDVYETTCNAVMHGLMELNASQDTPIIIGLLMCQNEDQAYERALGPSNPGAAWADAAVSMASIKRLSEKNGGTVQLGKFPERNGSFSPAGFNRFVSS